MSQGENPGRHLLIIDMDPDMRSEVEEVLIEQGFSVRTAATLEECWPILEKKLPDMVLLDIQTLSGNGQGVDTYEELKSRYPDLPVVVTAHNA